MMADEEKYTSVAIALHWVMAVLLITMFILGWYMVDLPKGSDERTWFFGLHKSIGLTLAMLAVTRLTWRIKQVPPKLPETISEFRQKLAKSTHWLLYFAMFLQPMSGYISSSFSGYKTKFWGMPLPHWGWKSPDLNAFFTDIHVVSSYLLIALVFLHISGVVLHLYEGDKAVLKRMMPGKK